MSIIIFILILAILVLIHEFGHFIAAKKSGVLVEEFGFGFPPRLFGIKKGETLYSINLIPLGGFVKLYGEEYDDVGADRNLSPTKRNRAFAFKHPSLKFVIIVAGVAMNLVLGITLSYTILISNGFQSEPLPLLKEYRFRFGHQTNKALVSGVSKNSPAEKAGITASDLALQYQLGDGIDQTAWKNISSIDQFIQTVRSADGQTVFIKFENAKNGEIKAISVVPRYDQKLKRAIIGVSLIPAAVILYEGPTQRVLSGVFHAYNITAYNINVMKQLIGFSVAEKSVKPVSDTVSGPFGILKIVDEIVKSSGKKLLMNLLNLTSLLSLSLAIFNILPFPALDGGRMVFALYEWVTRRRVHKNIERYLNFTGFALLIFLAILISINDILKNYQ